MKITELTERDQERIGRAIATGLQLGTLSIGVTLDGVFLRAGQQLPERMAASGIPPFLRPEMLAKTP